MATLKVICCTDGDVPLGICTREATTQRLMEDGSWAPVCTPCAKFIDDNPDTFPLPQPQSKTFIDIKGQLTIGEFLDILTELDSTLNVRFAFGYVAPTTIQSWRGVYSEAALGHDAGDYDLKKVTVAELIKRLYTALGKTHQGWKGDDYTFTQSTPLHVDNPGNWSSTEIALISYDDTDLWLYTEIRHG